MRIAVVGSGISGNLAARLLASEHDVTLLEAGKHPGGHANTVDVEVAGEGFSVDIGFMVFNYQTYPNFCRLLDLLDVPSRPSDMTLSVRCDATGLEYQGGTLSGLFAQRLNLVRPRFWQMLGDILRFNRDARRDAGSQALFSVTLAEYLRDRGYGRWMIDRYLRPMIAAIWSASPYKVDRFPVHFLLGFLRNHGLLQVRNQPQWRTVIGGSRQYVSALLRPLGDRLRLNCPVRSVRRHEDHVVVETAQQPAEVYDEAVLSTHADQSWSILRDADSLEREILGAFPYQQNEAVLHTDTTLLPKEKRAWASWNYHVSGDSSQPATVTYDLSRLQGHASAEPILLTLNETDSIDPAKVLRRFTYHHPAYRLESIAAQQRHGEISGRRRTHFCGAYWGNGFHEDGVNSALAIAEHFGIGLEACTVAFTKAASPITAARREPIASTTT